MVAGTRMGDVWLGIAFGFQASAFSFRQPPWWKGFSFEKG